MRLKRAVMAKTMIFAVLLLLVLYSGFHGSPGTDVSLNDEKCSSVRAGIAPFDDVANKTSFEVVAKAWSEQGITLFLPTWLPFDLKPTAAWVVIRDGKVGSLAIFLYSSRGIDRIATAELALEISLMEDIPFDPITAEGTFTTIKGWKIYYDEQIPVGWEEYNELYGPYSRLIDVQIGVLNYWYRGAPPLTMEDMIKIVESMEPARVG